MQIGRQSAINHLKIVTQSHKVGASAGMLQKTVVITLSITDAVTIQVKHNTGNNNHVSLISLVIRSLRWLKNTKTSPAQAGNSLNLPQNHLISTHHRIQYPLPCRHRDFQDRPGIRFMVGRRIKSNTFGSSEFLKRKEIPLRPIA